MSVNCFLSGHGRCSDKITREHYISNTVLSAIAPDGGLTIGGLAWQKEKMTLQGVGIGSLTSKILCKYHNSELSAFDNEAGKFIRHVIAVDKNPDAAPASVEFDGEKIQRWMLKTLIATIEAGAFSTAPLSPKHKKILMGQPWPSSWGLYAAISSETQIFTQDLYMQTAHCSDKNGLVAASFRFAGIQLWLVVANVDDKKQFGIYRPKGFVVNIGSETKKIGLRWRGPKRNKAIIFNKVGQGNMTAPHQVGWKELLPTVES